MQIAKSGLIQCLVVAAGVFMATPSLAENKPPITICGTTWGKYGGDDLPGKGFVPDLVMRVFRHAGYEIRTELIPWARCVQKAKNQQYDLVSSAWRGPNFAADFDPLNIILVDTVSFVTRSGSDIASGDMTSLYGRQVGFVKDAGGLKDILKDHPKIRINEVASLETLLVMLDKGRIDAILTDPVNLNEVRKGLKDPLKHDLAILEPAVVTNLNSPQIAKGHPYKEQIARDFDKAYRELVQQGLYADLIKLHDLQVQPPELK